MGYYLGARGDYYRGDYYRGRRGDLSSLLAGGAKLAANFLPGWASTAVKVAAPYASKIASSTVGKIAGAVGISLAAGKVASALSGPPVVEIGGQQYQVGGGRRRRMNVTNPRALRKALRRVAGFGKLACRARRDIGRAATAVGVKRGGGRRMFGRKRAA